MIYAVASGLIALFISGALYERIVRSHERQHLLPGRMVEVGGYRLHVCESGKGDHTVVIIHGAGESSYSWLHVQGQLSELARVVAFDRPGLGSSEPGPALDACGSVQEMHTLLITLEVPGPYVLVGHSLGGLIARLYALRYPNEVAGIVLVDSTHEFLKDDPKFRKGLAAVDVLLKILRATSPIGLPRFLGQVLRLMPMYPERSTFNRHITCEERRAWESAVYRNFAAPAAGREFGAVFAMLEDATRHLNSNPAIPQFGDMPLAVLTNPGFGQGWITMQRELATRSTNSVHWISDRRGHNMQMLRPDLVVNAIRHVVNQAAMRNRIKPNQ